VWPQGNKESQAQIDPCQEMVFVLDLVFWLLARIIRGLNHKPEGESRKKARKQGNKQDKTRRELPWGEDDKSMSKRAVIGLIIRVMGNKQKKHVT